METFGSAVLFLLSLLLVASCRAADQGGPVSPATDPAGLTASVIVKQSEAGWVAEVTLANNTRHALSTGRFTGFTLTRVDTRPARVIVATPPEMAPHFRVELPVGESRKASITIWNGPDALAPGNYHVAVSYPRDILPRPVEADFIVSAPATQKSPAH